MVYEAKEDWKSRVYGLNIVLRAERDLSEILGFVGITLKDIELQERLEKLRSEVDGLKRLAGSAEKNNIER